jgi:hypothetical protein
MALMITDMGEGNPQGLPCALARGLRLQALAVVIGRKDLALWL